MSNFDKSKFSISDNMMIYYLCDSDKKFVAKIKYGSPKSFINFLVKKFTTEEYFTRLKKETPMAIAESKGYFDPKIKRMLKESGYPQTRAGYNQYAIDKIKKIS